MVEAYLLRLGSSEKDEAAAQVALSSLVRVVKQLNRSLAGAAKEGTIGADALMSLSRRTNDYFTKFVGSWLKSDSIASHFVFELGGFEFLLDTIGTSNDGGGERAVESWSEETKEGQQAFSLGQASSQAEDDPGASDIYEVLYGKEDDGNLLVDAKAASQAQGDEGKPRPGGSSEQEQEAPLDEPPQLILGELANKQLVLTDDNTGGHVASTHSKVDWSCNKRAYKNRLMVTGLHGALRNEYWVLFKL